MACRSRQRSHGLAAYCAVILRSEAWVEQLLCLCLLGAWEHAANARPALPAQGDDLQILHFGEHIPRKSVASAMRSRQVQTTVLRTWPANLLRL